MVGWPLVAAHSWYDTSITTHGRLKPGLHHNVHGPSKKVEKWTGGPPKMENRLCCLSEERIRFSWKCWIMPQMAKVTSHLWDLRQPWWLREMRGEISSMRRTPRLQIFKICSGLEVTRLERGFPQNRNFQWDLIENFILGFQIRKSRIVQNRTNLGEIDVFQRASQLVSPGECLQRLDRTQTESASDVSIAGGPQTGSRIKNTPKLAGLCSVAMTFSKLKFSKYKLKFWL